MLTRRKAGVWLTCVLLAGCATGTERGTAAKPKNQVTSAKAEADRFPHDLHTGDGETIRSYKGRGLQCTDCHPKESVLKGEWARPGKNDHSPCDDCHKAEFYKPPGKFCVNCHTTVDPKVKGATKMQPYPERGFQRILASDFSHRVHLDQGSMESAVGFHVSCSDCHDRKDGNPTLPGHKQCARCHVEQAKARDKLDMGDCASCHPKRNVGLVRGRVFITGDLIFQHKTHATDKAGAAINCDICHDDIAASRSVKDASVPAMQRCALCHEDSAKTPDRVRIARCEVCHSEISAGTAPRSHMVGKAVPEDHTLEFRVNHGEAAAQDEARCGFCHDGMSGSTRDSCFQCHQLMKPRDHNLGWRDDSHGREASADRDRCQTCHTADYCTACHTQTPRSHQPLDAFSLGGHAQNARFDLSSCFACHTMEDTCSRCHRSVR